MIDPKILQLAVDNASDHIIITDPEGVIIYANKAVGSITGFSPQEVVGKKAGSKELWGGQMPIEFYKNLWHTIKIAKKPFFDLINNKRKNGEIYTAETHITPVLDDQGQVISFVGIERDVTKAQEVDRMKTEFISLASHQLRTPLTAVKWLLEELLAGDVGKLTAKQRELAEDISLSNERMISLVNSLLNVSRMESGRIIIDPKPADLTNLINSVITEISPRFEKKQITPTISVQHDLPQINLDPKLIFEVYKNLLTNALKYTPTGGRVNISITRESDEVLSQITDTGVGILPAEQPRIFEKFFRGSNVIQLETEGSGLGLYLTKTIIESSHGRIWFESTPQVGTTFKFTLPITGMQAKKGEVGLDTTYQPKA
ncbi:hypothetical protein A2368_04840 [Candidatus Collierbacteria bacterium RIFOXYB1_FULL_49_13]|uniref:histidine kinase n=1 Tax=Candidatus Collierbacteria bacterium RIFOXYB1_FULL_49_13 TaxID=1817728 RepID=A0A1F5FB84_9BACT|nr:MAG: hypothetical protein A2368_04840 [Candidatus Collierbacteria bacterium RIFOXYB1_FULL_49_13]